MEKPETTETIFVNRPEGMARILALDDTARDLWAAAEMQVIWQHQLSTPVDVDLGTAALSDARAPGGSSDLQPLLSQSFGHVLADPHSSLALLKMIKSFAKQTFNSAEDAQMKGVAAALYYAACAAGMVRYQQRLSGMGDTELKRGFKWALHQDWLGEPPRKLIEQAAELLPTES